MNDAFIGRDGEEFDESVSMAVVEAVAERRNVDQTELPPLYEWIDPNALDALFERTRTRGTRSGRITFTYDGHRITVERENGVSITIDDTTERGWPEITEDFRTDA